MNHKVISIISKPRSEKKYFVYCYECGNKQKLYLGRHWCTCNKPEYQMGYDTPEELEKKSKELGRLFKSLK
jgi:hypothetical protein